MWLPARRFGAPDGRTGVRVARPYRPDLDDVRSDQRRADVVHDVVRVTFEQQRMG